MHDESLETFQARLLDLLERGVPAAEVRAALLADPACAPFADYVSAFDLRGVAVASRIVKSWALRCTSATASSNGIGLAKK